jgi:pantoate--beta-alanine ligase
MWYNGPKIRGSYMLLHTIKEVREQIHKWRKDELTVGLVPTMGALHAGHMSLIKKAKETCDRVVVSDFVNPIQFGPSEDFDKYPRTLDEDVKLCEKEGVDIVFAPSANEMYGEGQKLSNDNLTYVCPPFFYVNTLCGKSRTGHFDGVCTVVLKLFNIVQPDFAFFGQKDAQQVIIIKKMVRDLNVPITIVQCPIVREESGLALSSRNQYLTENGRQDALVLSKILHNIKSCYKRGITEVSALKETAYNFLTNKHDLEYLEIVDKNTLEDKIKADNESIALIACRVEGVRLIDNIYLGEE